jgi:hypothetical protein
VEDRKKKKLDGKMNRMVKREGIKEVKKNDKIRKGKI